MAVKSTIDYENYSSILKHVVVVPFHRYRSEQISTIIKWVGENSSEIFEYVINDPSFGRPPTLTFLFKNEEDKVRVILKWM